MPKLDPISLSAIIWIMIKKQISRIKIILISILTPTLLLGLSPIMVRAMSQPPSGTFPDVEEGMKVIDAYSVGIGARDDVGIAKVEFLIDGKVFLTLPGKAGTESYYTFNLDATKLNDGVHTLSAKVYDDDNQSAFVKFGGVVGFYKNPAKGTEASFIVANTPRKPDEPRPKPNLCSQKQEKLVTIMARILERKQRRSDFIDETLLAVEKYYLDNNVKVTNYDSLVATIESKEAAADAAMDDSFSKSNIDCSLDLKTQVGAFKDSLKKTNDALKDYRKSVQSLIQAIKESK